MRKTSHMFLILISFVLLVCVSLGDGFATDNSRITAESIGDIRSGNTVQARQMAVTGVMEAAIWQAVQSKIKPAHANAYGDMLRRHLVADYGDFVRNHRIEKEFAERGQYHVRASVEVDFDRLERVLRGHGFIASEVSSPKLMLLIADRSQQGVEASVAVQPWWRQNGKRQFVNQNLLQNRLSGLPVQFASWKQVIQSNPQGLVQQLMSNEEVFPLDILIDLAKATDCQYIVMGQADSGFVDGQLVVVQVANRRRLGVVKWDKPTFDQAKIEEVAARLDAFVYPLMGMITADWLRTWQSQQVIVLRILGVRHPSFYAEFVEGVDNLVGIDGIQETIMRPGTIEVALLTSQKTVRMLNTLRRLPVFAKGASLKQVGDTLLEATLQ